MPVNGVLVGKIKGFRQFAEFIEAREAFALFVFDGRQIARLEAERAATLERLTDETVESFGRAVSAALRNPDNRAFARAYIQALISAVTVSAREVRITGPKAALLHQAALFAARGELVPSFAQDWRAAPGDDENYVYAIAL